MQKKYIKYDMSEVRYFDDGVNVSEWIDLSKYRLMTKDEIIKHETNPNTDYNQWHESQSKWIDPRTEEEELVYKRSQYPS